MKRYAAFDLEIAKMIPEGEADWFAHAPLGISCAAVATDDDYFLWYSGPDTDCLSQLTCQTIVDTLHHLLIEDYQIVTWNGLSFDLRVLAGESKMSNVCMLIAYRHIDLLFNVFCEKGYPCSLDKAAKGQGFAGKPDDMDGAKAPALWAEIETRQQVIDYLINDVEMTLELAKRCEFQEYIQWTSNSGKSQRVYLPTGWLTVDECLRLPEPDVSWMDSPWSRDKFIDWMQTGGEV